MAVTGPLAAFDTIGDREVEEVVHAIRRFPLSGFLGGQPRGGIYVQRLENEWASTFDVKHAIACNSATSGLLVACMAAGVGQDTEVITTPFTMSATAAAPAFLGADIVFGDIERSNGYGLDPLERPKIGGNCHAIIVTNLFGYPAKLLEWKEIAIEHGCVLIEDNAQAPFAKERGQYTGTIGDIGVFSLNVHKHIQCGEGGIVVTNDDDLAQIMRAAINHGEMANTTLCGLNLRMTEVTAAIAYVQLLRGQSIIEDRIRQAEAILDAVEGAYGISLPSQRKGSKPVYYTVPFLTKPSMRSAIVSALKREGVPVVEKYAKPLYRLPAFQRQTKALHATEDVYKSLFYIENCAWTFTGTQIMQIGKAFHEVGDRFRENSAA